MANDLCEVIDELNQKEIEKLEMEKKTLPARVHLDVQEMLKRKNLATGRANATQEHYLHQEKQVVDLYSSIIDYKIEFLKNISCR
jgi:hypothetical protein